MSFFLRHVLGHDRRFHSQNEIRAWMQDAFDEDENFITSDMLLLFEGTKQHTWLLTTDKALYCIFDVIGEPEPRVKWRIPREHALRDGRLSLQIAPSELSPSSERQGFVTINAKPKRKYSKLLFQRHPVDQAIRVMLMGAFNVRID